MNEDILLRALSQLPRWHVVHWATADTSTLLCLWVAGHETLIPVDESFATVDGTSLPVDGGLVDLLRTVQHRRDAEALATPAARDAQSWLLDQWRRGGPYDLLTWRFPRGGFLHWMHNGGLHIEASEDGGFDRPMPEPLRDVLVDLGWNAPDGNFRNCWLQPGEQELEAAAALCVLTPMAAFGYDVPPVPSG